MRLCMPAYVTASQRVLAGGADEEQPIWLLARQTWAGDPRGLYHGSMYHTIGHLQLLGPPV